MEGSRWCDGATLNGAVKIHPFLSIPPQGFHLRTRCPTRHMTEFTDQVQLPIRADFLGGQNGRFLPDNGTVMELEYLRLAFQPAGNDSFVERLIPERIVIREEMETSFKELLSNGNDTTTVFSGSPGVGKSILMFLVVLYRAAVRHEPAIYMRRTDNNKELMSEFAMKYNVSTSKLDVRFTREASRSIDMAVEHDNLRKAFQPAVRWTNPTIVDAVDGPKSHEFTRFSLLSYGCTSGAGINIKHHMAESTFNVVMGAWTEESLQIAIVASLSLDLGEEDEKSNKYFDTEKFDAVYFVNGGRIRGFQASYEGNISTEFADQVVSRVSKQQSALSLSHSDCRSTDEHVDSLRSMFRRPTGSTDSVSLHVDSGYLLRKLKEKVSGEELYSSYKKAESDGNKGAQANYFEELMHWCFCSNDISTAITSHVHAEGSGVSGVSELTAKNQYWIPSVPNFVNIDSAVIGSDGKVWCYQFTVSRTHTYKKRRTRSHFLNNITVLQSTDEVVLTFVVPQGTSFTEPDTGSELETNVSAIDCSALETVLGSVARLADKVSV